MNIEHHSRVLIANIVNPLASHLQAFLVYYRSCRTGPPPVTSHRKSDFVGAPPFGEGAGTSPRPPQIGTYLSDC